MIAIMETIMQMVFFNVLASPTLVNTTQTNQRSTGLHDVLCLVGMYGLVVVFVVIFLKLQNINKSSYSIQLKSEVVEIEEMPGKKVLRLEWEDSHNVVPGKKHYLVRKGYGKMPAKYEDVGSTSDFFLIDRTYQPGYTQFYVVVCMEDKRTSYFEIRNYSM